MKRLFFLLIPLVLLGAGCGDAFISGAAPEGGQVKNNFIIPGTVGASAIVAPNLDKPNRSKSESFLFELPR